MAQRKVFFSSRIVGFYLLFPIRVAKTMARRPLQIAYFTALLERLLVATLYKDYKSALCRSTKINTLHKGYRIRTIIIAYWKRETWVGWGWGVNFYLSLKSQSLLK